TAALHSGDHITITLNHSGSAAQISAIATEYSGLTTVSGQNTGHASGMSVNSGSVTVAGNTLLVGAASRYSSSGNTLTTDAQYTAPVSPINTNDGFGDQVSLGHAYRSVSAGTYSFNATWSAITYSNEAAVIAFTVGGAATSTPTPSATPTSTSTPT